MLLYYNTSKRSNRTDFTNSLLHGLSMSRTNYDFISIFSFDVNNDDWISTISEAFEGFSDFKKLK